MTLFSSSKLLEEKNVKTKNNFTTLNEKIQEGKNQKGVMKLRLFLNFVSLNKL